MSPSWKYNHMNKITCVIMDWAGTSIDFGCFAPLNAFSQAFSEKGLIVSHDQIRKPMGLLKIDHIRAILSFPDITRQFREKYGRNWSTNDLHEIYCSFEQHLFPSLEQFTDPIPGVLDVVRELRNQNIKIGSTTGYTREMMRLVQPAAEARGYVVDSLETPDGLPAGRPAPYMIHKNIQNLGILSVSQVVKVGDTIADIEEGRNAGVISIGVIKGSSELGLSLEEYSSLPALELEERKKTVALNMRKAGADFVLDNIEELPECLQFINRQ